MKASGFVALALALCLSSMASAVDTFTVNIARVGSGDVPVNGTVDFTISGVLTEEAPDSNHGLAFFAFDLELVRNGAGANAFVLDTDALISDTAAVANFKKNVGYSVDFTGTPAGADLVQLGGGQNTINNTGIAPFPPFPSGSVLLDVGHGAGVVMYTGTITVPAGAGEDSYTLRIKSNSLFANMIKMHTGNDYVVDPVGAVIGTGVTFEVTTCVAAPAIAHAAGLAGETAPCSGYIDPRRESTTNPPTFNAGLMSARIKFNVEVFKDTGADITGADFEITETGGGPAPTVTSAAYVGVDKNYVQVNWNRPLTVRRWTTIIAHVHNACGDPIPTNGNQGPGVNEVDRVDIAFLPADVNQNNSVSPTDLLAFKQVINFANLPAAGCSDASLDYVDMDRNGVANPSDLLSFKRLINNIAPSTQSWNGATLLNTRP